MSITKVNCPKCHDTGAYTYMLECGCESREICKCPAGNSERIRNKQMASIETYRCVAVSTGHLTESDKELLTHSVTSTNMIMERDTGWFMKLYSEPGNWEGQCEGFSDNLTRLVEWAHKQGYRMIEFDCDADYHPDFEAVE